MERALITVAEIRASTEARGGLTAGSLLSIAPISGGNQRIRSIRWRTGPRTAPVTITDRPSVAARWLPCLALVYHAAPAGRVDPPDTQTPASAVPPPSRALPMRRPGARHAGDNHTHGRMRGGDGRLRPGAVRGRTDRYETMHGHLSRQTELRPCGTIRQPHSLSPMCNVRPAVVLPVIILSWCSRCAAAILSDPHTCADGAAV